jgi:hypothetical protein
VEKMEQKIERIRQFLKDWISVACALRTPHCDVGHKVLQFLIDHPEQWAMIEPHVGTSVLFDRTPTMDDFIADLYDAEEKGFKTVDTALGTQEDNLKNSAARVIKCAELVRCGEFSTKSDRHCSAFDVLASTPGLLSCSPKSPPDHFLTSAGFRPRGL